MRSTKTLSLSFTQITVDVLFNPVIVSTSFSKTSLSLPFEREFHSARLLIDKYINVEFLILRLFLYMRINFVSNLLGHRMTRYLFKRPGCFCEGIFG